MISALFIFAPSLTPEGADGSQRKHLLQEWLDTPEGQMNDNGFSSYMSRETVVHLLSRKKRKCFAPLREQKGSWVPTLP